MMRSVHLVLRHRIPDTARGKTLRDYELYGNDYKIVEHTPNIEVAQAIKARLAARSKKFQYSIKTLAI